MINGFCFGDFIYLRSSPKFKMMENALDTLKTAFPHPEPLSPTEDLEGDADVRIMDSRKYR